MLRETKSTWILVGVLALLGAGAIAEQAREKMLLPKPLLKLTLREVKEISRDCGGCVSLHFAKRQGEWEITQPFSAPADEEQVQKLVEIAASPVRRSYAATELEPDKIGLVPPFATLILGSRTLEFGTTEPIRNDRYVRAGSVMALVQDNFSQLLTASPESFVDRRPMARTRRLVSARVMGNPMDAQALENLGKLVAVRVEPPPTRFAAHNIDVEIEGGRRAELKFEIRGDELALVRVGVPVVYMIDRESASSIGLGW